MNSITEANASSWRPIRAILAIALLAVAWASMVWASPIVSWSRVLPARQPFLPYLGNIPWEPRSDQMSSVALFIEALYLALFVWLLAEIAKLLAPPPRLAATAIAVSIFQIVAGVGVLFRVTPDWAAYGISLLVDTSGSAALIRVLGTPWLSFIALLTCAWLLGSVSWQRHKAIGLAP